MDGSELDETGDIPLPGLEPVPTDRAVARIELQVRRSLARLQQDGLVDDRHAGLMQLALEYARTIGRGGPAYGIAQAGAQLLAVFDKLMPDTEGGGTDDFTRWQSELRKMDSRGSGPEVRDPAHP